ncbi:MAG: hypothetical protein ACI9MR_002340 [Myxococcota bacterium]|jgi:hypothetical protein
MLNPTRLLALICALSLLLTGACDDEVTGGAILPKLKVTAVGPTPVVPGTRLTVKGTGFVVSEVAEIGVLLRGTIGGELVEFGLTPIRLDDETLIINVLGEVETQLIRDDGRFIGTVNVIRAPVVNAEVDVATIDVNLSVARVLTPILDDVSPRALWVGEEVTLSGGNFLHPSEGFSLLQLDGVITTTSPPRSIQVQGLQVPVEPPNPERRDTSRFVLTPDVLGIVPGQFSGQLTVVNTTHSDMRTSSASLDVGDMALERPLVESMSPLMASRGQRVTLTGRGFTPPDGLLQSAMVLVLDGQFTAASGGLQDLTGANAITLVPSEFNGNTEVQTVVRVDLDTDGKPTGLGLIPGTFVGTVYPLVLFGADTTRGQALPVTFEVLPQVQIVYLKLLPGFDQALTEFGLLTQRDRIKTRVLEVLERDYAGVSIRFTFEVPLEFAEYSVVEIAGRDPNGSGLFGLDNTTGKDTGNVRFDDVIGGYNAETNADGFAAYGGVFPGEFLQLSVRAGNNDLASPRFDDIFGPVSPALGGTPAGPDDGQDTVVAEAVRVFGSLLGNTVSHEIGHSLGLASVVGEFHNIGDNPGWIMDRGGFRPFAERGEVDGQGPAIFSPANQRYLQEILPLP